MSELYAALRPAVVVFNTAAVKVPSPPIYCREAAAAFAVAKEDAVNEICVAAPSEPKFAGYPVGAVNPIVVVNLIFPVPEETLKVTRYTSVLLLALSEEIGVAVEYILAKLPVFPV